MPARDLLILDTKESPWRPFLEEFFNDTPSKLYFFHDSSAAGSSLDKIHHNLIFMNPKLISLPFTQKINVLRHSSSSFRAFRLGNQESPVSEPVYNDYFEEIPTLIQFQKKLLERLALPEKIRVLLVDDEPEIGSAVGDFLEGRVNPIFEFGYAPDGEKGLAAIAKSKPDVLILDIKMPVKDGREVYREVIQQDLRIPVIVFFDAISGDEISEIHRFGNPAIVEKGSRQSSMPELLSLIKKMAYFG